MFQIIVVGAGGFGQELWHWVRDAQAADPRFRVKGFLDDDSSRLAAPAEDPDRRIIGDTASYVVQDDDRFVISVGDPTSRARLAQRLLRRGAKLFTIVHPTVRVAASATLGPGCVLGPFANIGHAAHIGANVLVNLYATVGHDARIGDDSVLSPYAAVSGQASVSPAVFLGTHAVVTPGISVGFGSKVAAGSVVYEAVPARSMAAGNPAAFGPLAPVRPERRPTRSYEDSGAVVPGSGVSVEGTGDTESP